MAGASLLSKFRFLVTGGQGFLGSYIARKLLQRKAESVALFDLKADNSILNQVLESNEIPQLKRINGDISNTDSVRNAVEQTNPTHIIHLAALQVPACRSNPILGAQVNVVGSMNLFEQIRLRKESQKFTSLVYASSAAVAGFFTDYKTTIQDDTPHIPRTHYGVFKLANEGNARVYWFDHGISSIGLRPHTVYGVGREIGITSGPSKAIKATILKRKFVIPFIGSTSFNYVEDIADVFIECALANVNGAFALNIQGSVMSIEKFVQTLYSVLPESKELISIQSDARPLPLAYDFSQKGLDQILPKQRYTSIEEGIKKTADRFRELHRQGVLHDRDLS